MVKKKWILRLRQAKNNQYSGQKRMVKKKNEY